MYRSIKRLFLAVLGFLAITGFVTKMTAQQRGVQPLEMTSTIVIHEDGSSTYEIQTRNQIVTVTATGQRLVMPSCQAEPNGPQVPPEWHLRKSARNTGTQCIITMTTSHSTLESLRERIRDSSGGSLGDLKNHDGWITLTIIRNDPPLRRSPLLRTVITYKYLITLPYIDSFSNGNRQRANQVAFATNNISHSLEVLGHLSAKLTNPRAQPPPSSQPPTAKPTSSPTPTVTPTPSPTPMLPGGREVRPYVGCWAAQDGNVVSITPGSIQTARSHRPLAYKEVFRDERKNLYLLNLLEVDESKELQPFLGIEIVSNQMKTNNYASYADFLTRRSVGHENWSRKDCQDVLPLLRYSGQGSTPATPKTDSKPKKALKDVWNKIKKPT
jgi:hypothetical protein